MKFKHVGNATFCFETETTRILCDPWFNDGIFVGTWCHYPPVKHKVEDFLDVDYLYISHIHEDHFEVESLKKFRRDIPVICLDRTPNFVASRLKYLGFTNVKCCPEFESVDIDGKFRVTLFGAAADEMGELVDSSILFDFASEGVVFNANDNPPTKQHLEYIKGYCAELMFALIPQGGGSAFPVMYDNLTLEEKKSAVSKNVSSLVQNFANGIEFLHPKYVMPVGGQFIVSGHSPLENRLISKPYLEEDGEKEYLKNNSESDVKFLYMKSGDVFNFSTDVFDQGDGVPFSATEKDSYVESKMNEPRPNILTLNPKFHPRGLDRLFKICRELQWKKQQQMDLCFDYSIYFDVEGKLYGLNYSRAEPMVLKDKSEYSGPYMEITVSKGDFMALLLTMIDWNAADGSYRLRFYREPEQYLPKAYTLLSFLHL